MSLRVLTIYGTRPEAIKVAPVIKAIDAAPDMTSIAVVTGQHREMLDQVNALFDLVPSHDMNIMHHGQGLNSMVAKVASGVDALISNEAPDVALVQGDTTTVMAAGIASFNRQIPLVHLEAGLRSGDLRSPFPEEANRKVASALAALHLCPTSTSRANLLREDIPSDDIVITGNTVIDALFDVTKRAKSRDQQPRFMRALSEARNRPDSQLVLATAHRRENLGEGMRNIAMALADLAKARSNLTIVFPVHRNPKVRETVLPALEGIDNVYIIEPLSYDDFAHVLQLVDIVLTDSGGVQEEAPSLGKPVLVLRDNTERPEAVAYGTVKLVGTDRNRIFTEASMLLDSNDAYRAMANAVNPYGDGKAAHRTVEAIRWKFIGGSRPRDFSPEIAGNR